MPITQSSHRGRVKRPRKRAAPRVLVALVVACAFGACSSATVANIDRPSQLTLTPDQQHAELGDLLDRATLGGFNAVFSYIRPASDAVLRFRFGGAWTTRVIFGNVRTMTLEFAPDRVPRKAVDPAASASSPSAWLAPEPG